MLTGIWCLGFSLSLAFGVFASRGVAILPRLVDNARRDRAVVQLGRTLEWGSRGRGFKSRQPDSFTRNFGKVAAVRQLEQTTIG